ncbi:MAG TPA: LuxR C-terminal-related transcriptional regulator [Dehalococcoidia bacterium]
MLETIRAFAAEQLAASDEGEVLRERHALSLLAALEQHGPFLGLRTLPAPVMGWLDGEHNDMRAALDWGLAAPARSEIALRMAVGLAPHWNARGFLSEGRRWLEAALDAGREAQAAIRGDALLAASNLAWFQTDYIAARAHAEAGLRLKREERDDLGVAYALDFLSVAETMLGHFEKGRACSEESVGLFRSLNHKHGLLASLNDLAMVARLQRDHSAASATATEQLALAREDGNRRSFAFALRQLGRIAAEQGKLEQARRFLEESLAEYRQEADKSQIGGTLTDLGHVMLASGDSATSRACAEEAYALFRTLGATASVSAASLLLGHVERTEGKPAQSAMYYAKSIEQFVAADSRRHAIFGVAGIAGCALALGWRAKATRLLAVTRGLPDTRGLIVDPTAPATYKRDTATARAVLGEEGFAVAWTAGEALSWDEAFAEALTLAKELQESGDVGRHAPTAAVVPGPAISYPDGLSAREVEVLCLIAAGKSTREIAEELTIAEGTVERHVTNLYGKMGVRNRAEATSYAHANGLVAAAAVPNGLSAREVEVLRLIALGKSNREIATQLVISENTVFQHVRSILNKTGCANRTEAAVYAHAHGLADSHTP